MVGGKCASLGEMTQRLKELGVNVPFGFAVTAQTYQLVLDENRIYHKGEEITLREYIATDSPLEATTLPSWSSGPTGTTKSWPRPPTCTITGPTAMRSRG
ncbi:MAG: hypothetical protein Kow0069_25820 [Promethearchaeota archaeon]